jgi:hypothetical protein
VAWIPPDAYFNKGYLFTRDEPDWPALLIGRSVLFEVRDALGYSPVQLPGTWSYLHETNDLPLFYNAAVLQLPTAEQLRMLGVRYLIVRDDGPLPPGISGEVVASEGAYRLIDVDGSEPLVSVVPSWEVVADQEAALGAALEPGFDPATLAVLEADPGIASDGPGVPGTAARAEIRPETVRLAVSAGAPSIAVIRTAWDEGWEATVDGEPATVLRVDSFLQGVAVNDGEHEVILTYSDPWIGRGLLGSAIVWGGLAIAFAGVAVITRRRRRTPRDA